MSADSRQRVAVATRRRIARRVKSASARSVESAPAPPPRASRAPAQHPTFMAIAGSPTPLASRSRCSPHRRAGFWPPGPDDGCPDVRLAAQRHLRTNVRVAGQRPALFAWMSKGFRSPLRPDGRTKVAVGFNPRKARPLFDFPALDVRRAAQRHPRTNVRVAGQGPALHAGLSGRVGLSRMTSDLVPAGTADRWCVEHVRRLGGASPPDNLMEVKSM